MSWLKFLKFTKNKKKTLLLYLPTFPLASARIFSIDYETRGTRIFDHMAPRMVGSVISPADGSTQIPPHPSWAIGLRAFIPAGDTSRRLRC